ncbi:Gfo/Idh/MocA family oxidoreductase [Streptococcus gallolyticus]|uniref:Gfo/Idh/MocA family oxidoreductase n=1 Tax=Streptococcus gallolyticus TaxID=315405 RepID=UPI002284CFCC|nr:Gfo/Idh/MocA family oxidoreductase [Streptococcus gallolyticus]MCY7165721.1 Gfo/Idh/MocA family oxidoreductase [Streptococcus gallolyticus subsp. gallolyticus]MCY7182818.1 Gfo/Idh/MocA family oxidoreductase [Streptococcus gallolyticus subsp. gallolyticus]
MTKRLTIGYYGNGKSTNRYHLPFLMRRQDTIFVKTIYAPTLRDDWARWEGVHYTDKLDDLLNDPEIDVVVVTTPAPAHYETAKQVLEAGKNLVLEKPFTQSVKESQELFDLAREKGLMIQGYQNRRFDSDFLTTQAVIASGKLGDLLEVEMHYDYYRPEVPENVTQYSKDESYVYNHACHTVDQVISYFGKPDDVQYDVRQLLGAGRMNDYFDIDFYYQNSTDVFHVAPGGLKVSVKSSYFRVKERPSFVVYGRKGMFVKYEKDRQEADLKKFYLPDNDDFGLDKPENFGTLTYYDDNGHYHEEAIETVAGDNGRFYDALYETLINHKPTLVTEEQTMLQMHILEEATKDLK